jgi:hypothetical protein
MHTITFFPLGNADSTLLTLHNGQRLLFDYGNKRDPENADDRRIDLAAALREDLEEASKDTYDVVGFTHGDDDHTHGVGEFFYLDHAACYQHRGRIKIRELWVPAAMIVEEGSDGDARIVRQEARFRLLNNYGIRIFSRPAKLQKWLTEQGLTLQSRAHLITDAGQVVPGFNLSAHGIEFFAHSPFGHRQANGEVIDRNEHSLVLQVTFAVDSRTTRLMLSADTIWEAWELIVRISRAHGNDSRLEWDIFKLPHHCSYLSIGPEKGKEKTTPTPEVDWLYSLRPDGAVVVSTSDPIPSIDTVQPPHRQAANYHKGKLSEVSNGQFIVTMEHPKVSNPDKLVIEVTAVGATVAKRAILGGASVITRPTPRAGLR